MAIRMSGTAGAWILPEGETTLGRSEKCGMRIEDARLSRQHARFVVTGAQVVVHDLGSHNGVLCNGDRIQRPTAVRAGDHLVCGPIRLVVAVDDEPAPSKVRANPLTETLRSLVGEAPGPQRSTEAMDAVVVAAALRDAGPQPASRLNPAIAAAVSGGGERTGGSTTIRPSEMLPAISSGALSPHRFQPPPPPADVVRRTTSILPSEAPDLHTEALVAGAGATQAVSDPGRAARWLVGVGDPVVFLLLGAASGLVVALVGSMAALLWAGAGVAEGQLQIPGPVSASPLTLLQHLLAPATWMHLESLARLMQRAAGSGPFSLLFLSWAVGAVVVELALLLGLVAATVQRGGPWLHRRAGLVIVVKRNGHHPGWIRALVRWAVLLLTAPVALVTAACGVRGIHDRLAGCEVRRRA
jgi:FHA domain